MDVCFQHSATKVGYIINVNRHTNARTSVVCFFDDRILLILAEKKQIPGNNRPFLLQSVCSNAKTVEKYTNWPRRLP